MTDTRRKPEMLAHCGFPAIETIQPAVPQKENCHRSVMAGKPTMAVIWWLSQPNPPVLVNIFRNYVGDDVAAALAINRYKHSDSVMWECLVVCFGCIFDKLKAFMSVYALHSYGTSTKIAFRLCFHSFCSQRQIPTEVHRLRGLHSARTRTSTFRRRLNVLFDRAFN